MEWFFARLAEPNSRRAIAVVVGVLGLGHVLDPETIGLAARNIEQAGMLMLAFDAFVTRPKA